MTPHPGHHYTIGIPRECIADDLICTATASNLNQWSVIPFIHRKWAPSLQHVYSTFYPKSKPVLMECHSDSTGFKKIQLTHNHNPATFLLHKPAYLAFGLRIVVELLATLHCFHWPGEPQVGANQRGLTDN